MASDNTRGKTGAHEPDDVDLIKRGDRAAQRRLVEETGPAVLAVLSRFLDCPEDKKDAFQETYLNAFKSIDQFRGDSAITTWLVSIARNCALSKLRERKQSFPIAEGCDPADYDEFGLLKFPKLNALPEFNRLLETRDNQLIVRDAVMKLPDIHRSAILLKDFEGLSLLEISRELDISVSAAKVRIHRARYVLRNQLMDLFKANDDL